MTNKVQKIREEIERRIEQCYRALSQDLLERERNETNCCLQQYKELFQFINSLPEESGYEVNFTTKSEYLDYLVTSLEETIGTSPHSREVIKEHLQKAAEWQKQQMMKDTIECIVEDWCGDSPEITIPLNPQDFKTNDKVKIIIIKEEQQ